MTGGMAGGLCGGGYAWQRVCMVCMVDGVHVRGYVWHGVQACVAGEMATAADSTHPTAMHSCVEFEL